MTILDRLRQLSLIFSHSQIETSSDRRLAGRWSVSRFALVVSMFLAFPDLSIADETVSLMAGFPRADAEQVATDVSINLRFSDALNPKTLTHLRLIDPTDASVPIRIATDLTNASITITPEVDLMSESLYRLIGTADVQSQSGQKLTPFERRFRTGNSPSGQSMLFESETFDNTRSMTTILFGPDRRLYAASAFGELVRWDIDESGQPYDRTVLLSDSTTSRQYIDLEWDPEATAERLILWASFAERLAERDERFYFTGTVVRIELGEQITERTVIRGLPHGRERQGGFDTLPHQPNGLVFRHGKLYQTVGSTSSSGGPANWGLPEQPLSASVLEYDYPSISEPVDVHPDSIGDLTSAESPVRIFASGVRNALELVAHSNGRLYTATNLNDRAGPQDGVPDHPKLPGDQNQLIRMTTPDQESLLIIEQGRHYGFPNPSRGQYVLQGGNPSDGVDPFEIADYPIGTQPDTGFAPELMHPIWQQGGTSANGMIEYRPASPHPATGCLLCCFYSSQRIAVLRLGDDGLPVDIAPLRSPNGKLSFNGPLDITQDPATGNLYIADFGTQNRFGANGSLKLLRPTTPE